MTKKQMNKNVKKMLKKGIYNRLTYVENMSWYKIYYIDENRITKSDCISSIVDCIMDNNIKSIRFYSNEIGFDTILECIKNEFSYENYKVTLENDIYDMSNYKKDYKIKTNLFKYKLDKRSFCNREGKILLIDILNEIFRTTDAGFIKFDIDFK